MQTIKNNFVPTLIILIASAVVVFAAWPLENTQFAEDMRIGAVEEGEGIDSSEGEPLGEEGGGAGIALMIIGPLLKFTIFTAVGFLLTAIGRGVARLVGRVGLPRTDG